MNDNTQNNSELEQMQKLDSLTKNALSFLKRHCIFFALVFILIFGIALAGIWYKTSLSPKRFEARTTLTFYPKNTERIKCLENDQVMRIICRHSLMATVVQTMGSRPNDNVLGSDFSITQDENQRNCYEITAWSRTQNGATERVNTYADAAIAEYIRYRLEDLNSWNESSSRRRAEISAELATIESEEQKLNQKYGISSIEKEIAHYVQSTSDNKNKLNALLVEIADTDVNLKHLTEQLGNVPIELLDEADQVHKFASRMEQIDAEILRTQQLFTDENPRVQVLTSERAQIIEQYKAFLAKYNLENISEAALQKLNAASLQIKEGQLKQVRLLATQKTLEADIENGENRMAALMEILPHYDSLRLRKEALFQNRRSCDDLDADVRYLEASTKEELTQMERAENANQRELVSKKLIVVCFLAATLITGLLAALSVLHNLRWGKIYDMQELSLNPDLVTLCKYDGKNESGEELYLNLIDAMGSRKTAFIAHLKGASQNEKFMDTLSYQCALGGIKFLRIDFVEAKKYKEPANATTFAAVSYVNDRGWMPVESINLMTPSEVSLMEADLKILSSDFDLILVNRTLDFDGQSVFAAQMRKLCDATILLIGPKKTPRQALRNVLNTKNLDEESTKESHPFMAIMTALKSVAILLLATALLSGCYTARLTENFEQFPDMDDVVTDSVDESGMSARQLAERDAFLQALDNEPPNVYRINAGDRLRLVVYNHDDLCTDVTVTPDGYIGMVFLGQVPVEGLTLAEACRKIDSGLERYIKKPSVGLTPIEILSETVTISGATSRPGMYGIVNGMRLADLYAKSGGSSVRRINDQDLDAADLTHSYLVRDGQTLPIDFTEAITKGNKLHNVRLKRGDYIYIGVRSESMICVVGDVRSPYKYLADESVGIIELLASSGWVNETYHPFVVVLRGTSANPHMYKVDVDAILAGRRPNVSLKPGDIVYVPHDDISEFNVFIRKLLPSGELYNLLMTPYYTFRRR